MTEKFTKSTADESFVLVFSYKKRAYQSVIKGIKPAIIQSLERVVNACF